MKVKNETRPKCRWIGLRIIQNIFNLIFFKGSLSSKARFFILILTLFLIWLSLALILHPLTTNPENHFILQFISNSHSPVFKLLFRIIAAFFSLDTIIRIAAIFSSFLFAKRYAAAYASLIYDQVKVKDIEKLFNNAILPKPNYSIIDIEDLNASKKFENSTIFKIGGPGKIIIGLGNAVILERNGGILKFLGPTITQQNHQYILQWFERPREIIDLHDKFPIFDVQCRTKDGIRLDLKHIQLHLYINRKLDTNSLIKSHPLKRRALEEFYKIYGYSNWYEFLINYAKTQIINLLRKYTLKELLINSTQQMAFTETQQESILQKFIRKQKIINARIIHKNKPLTSNLKKLGKRKKSKGLRKHPKGIHQSMFIKSLILPMPEETEIFNRDNLINFIRNNFSKEIKKNISDLGIHLELTGIETWKIPYSSISNQSSRAWSPSMKNEPALFGAQKRIEIQEKIKTQEIVKYIKDITRNTILQINNNYPKKDEQSNIILKSFLTQLIKLRGEALEYGLRIPTGFSQLISQLEDKSYK